ncbi:uncharacterized protein si:dkey-24l11.2 [Astyanax mexicanus]|uniref:uncharacterized protein si:dkey-24l11.2 n=1 Tax=Astyanax mexicanus TaxID=7994 RepID=UPI0020CB4EBC|nr:uncharacterized protein si:dkey-24l11.2 [Astyanax mexicanus]
MDSPGRSAEQHKDHREDFTPDTQPETSQQPTNPAQPPAQPSAQPLCRFYSQGRFCHFGKRCHFLHQRFSHAPPPPPQQQAEEREDGASEKEGRSASSDPRTAPSRPVRAQRPCRYFMSGFCSMEDRCRFWHPQKFPPVEEQPAAPRDSSSNGARPVSSRPPTVKEQIRLADLTEELIRKLRETEISQLKKRFPKDKLIIQEREDGQLTYYRLTVEATDPEWPYDLKEIDIMVSFPDNYPQEVFTVDVPEDQHLPSVMGRHIQSASQEWLQAKHATSQLLGKVELLFRPYLHWLDRSMERLFTEGARELKKDIDLERAGIQFVPYELLQATVCRNSDELPEGSRSEESLLIDCKVKEECESDEEAEEEEVKNSQGEENESQQVENIRSSEPRKGTEIKLMGLRLGEGTATVVARQITVSMQCNRCKVTSDLSLSGGPACSAQCEKCGSEIRAGFRPSMLHHYSDVLGYLDLHAAAAVDLVLQDCSLRVGCLSCNNEDNMQCVPYGQNKETNCQHCHNKLSIFVESARFQYIQPKIRKTTDPESALQAGRSKRDPAIQRGKPLPEKGVCKHYRQSHRWLRFPCCGRAYPCDACHDEDQDHLMELATRMICGYCAKEQPYSNGKPCVGCGGMMTRGTFTSHWEGGLGCRNKAKMSRNDRHKYTNTNKTVSRKANSEK